jgi:hypothetical protein
VHAVQGNIDPIQITGPQILFQETGGRMEGLRPMRSTGYVSSSQNEDNAATSMTEQGAESSTRKHCLKMQKT